MPNDFTYKMIKPGPVLSDFVESFWMLANTSETDKEVVILPDGRIDLFFSYSATEPFHVMLMELDIEPSHTIFPATTLIFAISFKLPAVEYILDTNFNDHLNNHTQLPEGFWDITIHDLNDFDSFVEKVSKKMSDIIEKKSIDERKRKLFEHIYSSNGAMTVKELSERSYWSSRQINRYFNQYFGISLKAYCNILRFRASLLPISEGKLFPEQNFSDQAHFIRDIKKHAGVTPKELSKNKDGRFIQFLALPKK